MLNLSKLPQEYIVTGTNKGDPLETALGGEKWPLDMQIAGTSGRQDFDSSNRAESELLWLRGQKLMSQSIWTFRSNDGAKEKLN